MSDHLRAHETAAPMLDSPSGPLRGLRIVDVTHAAAGPFGAMMLADLGADVIKVEPPGGELVRFGAPKPLDETEHRYSGRYANRNRNKRSIALDLDVDDDRETFLQLVETADGLLENMRAGVLDRLGVGWEVCHARNPRLVYAAIRGFGDPRTGASPYGEWPAFDAVAQSMGGFVSMTGPDAEHPMRTGPAVGDLVPGLMAALGLVSALLHAQRSGEGQFVDVAMVDGLMSLCEPAQMLWSYKGADSPPAGNAVDGISPFDIYPTADGHCAVVAPTDSHWNLLCGVIGRPDLADDARTRGNRARVRNKAFVDEVVGGWFAAHTNAEIVDALGGKVSVGPVLGARDWVDDPHVASRQMLVRVDHPHHRPTVQLNCPIKFTATPSGIYRRPPFLDEHGDELRAELGGGGAAPTTGQPLS
jgi:crotonobetainyl-CoA:carnitine CoA-transferase CaiB-like acyl-CoA transferase